jgi:hypothetical protein
MGVDHNKNHYTLVIGIIPTFHFIMITIMHEYCMVEMVPFLLKTANQTKPSGS